MTTKDWEVWNESLASQLVREWADNVVTINKEKNISSLL